MNYIFDTNDSVTSKRYISTPSSNARKGFFYIQETGYLKSLKPHVSARENVASYLLVHILSGEGFFTLGGRRIKASAGACFFVDCMQPYSHESTKDSPWELLWVHFNGATSAAYYEYFLHGSPPVFYPFDSAPLIGLLHQMMDLCETKPPYYEALSSRLIMELLTFLITTDKKQYGSNTQHTSTDEKLQEIHHYLSSHIQEDISLDILSERFYISKYYLCREFKKKYGEGIGSYLTNKRITLAKQLLRFTQKNISDIAEQCGIADANYFVKQFKSAEGMTPSEYRKKWV